MNTCKTAVTFARLVLLITLVAAPSSAQRRRTPAPKPQPPAQPAPTFDTLLAADTYRVYGEVRGVGQLVRSSAVNDVLDPLVKFTAPPKEFRTLVKWLNSHGDALMTSRVMFAGWPSRPKLPQALVVIEFPSTEDAQKFEPQLKGFLPKLLPTPAPDSSPTSPAPKGENSETKLKGSPATTLPYVIKQSGPLVFISDAPFSFKALRPAGSKLLSEDHNFRQAHDRFSSESVFVYFDVASMEKEEQDRRRIQEEEEKKRIEAEAANPPKPEETPEAEPPAPTVVPEPALPDQPTPDAGAIPPDTPQPHETKTRLAIAGPSAFDLVFGSLFSSRPVWPQAIGVAATFDGDSYSARALLINDPETKGNIIPFISQIVSGPALVPQAASILPADTQVFISASLDYPLMYDGILKAATRNDEAMRGGGGVNLTVKESQPESPFAAYEAQLGIKIKEDLLPLLGNEIAVALPVKRMMSGSSQPAPTPSGKPDDYDSTPRPPPRSNQPVIAIAVKDREAVRTLIPKIIDSMGVKGASQLGQTEKRDDTELVTYANVLSYAFIGNFLIVSPDSDAARQVVDSYLNHDTLASDTNFRNYTRWQPRQLLGQVYVSSEVIGSFSEISKAFNPRMNDQLTDFLSRLNPTVEPLTYAISNEGQGPLHELRIPKNLLLLMIAGMATEKNQPPSAMNEAMTQSALRVLASAQATYKETSGNGHYATIEQLLEKDLIQKDLLEKYGYKIEVTVLGTRFEASAVPLEYGKTGSMSFFIDESSVIRGGDHGGGAATVSDKPVQ